MDSGANAVSSEVTDVQCLRGMPGVLLANRRRAFQADRMLI